MQVIRAPRRPVDARGRCWLLTRPPRRPGLLQLQHAGPAAVRRGKRLEQPRHRRLQLRRQSIGHEQCRPQHAQQPLQPGRKPHLVGQRAFDRRALEQLQQLADRRREGHRRGARRRDEAERDVQQQRDARQLGHGETPGRRCVPAQPRDRRGVALVQAGRLGVQQQVHRVIQLRACFCERGCTCESSSGVRGAATAWLLLVLVLQLSLDAVRTSSTDTILTQSHILQFKHHFELCSLTERQTSPVSFYLSVS
jgi:hypothetical protein